MLRRRPIFAALIVTIGLAASSCSDSPDSVTTDTDATPVPTESIDLSEDAFERNESQSEQPGNTAVDDAPPDSSAGVTTEVVTDDAPVTTDDAGAASTDGAADDGGTPTDEATTGGESTTGGNESTDGAATTGEAGDTTGGNESTDDGSTDDGSTDGAATTGGGTDGGGSTIPAVAVTEPATGLIRVDTTDYGFSTSMCDIREGAGLTTALVIGQGTLANGQAFEIEIAYDLIDIDEDGTLDENFDLFIDHIPGENDDGPVPELFAFRSVTAERTLGGDVSVEIAGAHITGTGPIADDSGIAVPFDQTVPMSFDVLCP